tara:strand:+ start:398 stop:604 length:207 start_codon:yes stop_codon:yes gene_type:complete
MRKIEINEEMPISVGVKYSAAYFSHRIKCLEAALEEIERVALASDGVAFYAMVARKGLDGEFDYDGFG